MTTFARLLAIFLLAVAALVPLRTLATQQSSPEPSEPGNPKLGEAILLFDSDGSEIASISVVDLVDPYLGFDPDWPPEQGYHFVMAHVRYQNTGDEPLADGFGFQVVDTSGFVYQNDVFAERTEAEQDAVPNCCRALPAPGETVDGAVLFQVPDGAQIAQVMCDIQGLERVALLDLRKERPRYGDVVSVTDETGDQVATVSASEPIDPYLEIDATFLAEPGSRVIGLPVSVANLGSEPYLISPGHFGLIGSDRLLRYPSPFVLRPVEAVAAEPDFASDVDSLAPGQAASGYVFFNVLEGISISSIIYAPTQTLHDRLYVRHIQLAETGVPAVRPSPPPTPTSEPAPEPTQAMPPTPTPNAACEGVVAWADDVTARLDSVTSEFDEMPALFGDEELDVSTLDPELYRQVADALRGLAEQQESSNPPTIAAEANAVLVRYYELVADGADSIADAIEAGDQEQFNLTVEVFGEDLDTFITEELNPTFEALTVSCPELNETA